MTGQNIPNIFDLQAPEPEEPEEPKESEKATEIAAQSVEPGSPGSILFTILQAQGIEVPVDKVDILNNSMQSAQYGHQAEMLLTCKGLTCPILSSCPLHKAEIELPVDEKCPYEAALMSQWVNTYCEALEIDPNAPENKIDMFMVCEVAGNEIIRNRAAHRLAKEGDLVSTKIVGYSPQGEPIYDDKPSMALLVLERQAKAVGKLREHLLATRKAQAQVGQVPNDITTRAVELRAKALELSEKRRKEALESTSDHAKQIETNFPHESE